jgi:KDO2-lipid IV(A) lauroyltransferase
MSFAVRLTRSLIALGARVPLPAVHALGRALGGLVQLARAREWRVAARNIALVFGDRDAAAQATLVRDTLAHAGMGLTELAWVYGRPRDALARVREVIGGEHLAAALAGGRGVLVAAPHQGSWELLNLWLSVQGPLTILYRVPQRPAFEKLLVDARGALGAEAVRAEASGVRLLFRRLKEGRMVGILPDQRPKGGEGVEVPFFGRPTVTMSLLARLAHKTGAPVLLAAAERLPNGAGWTIRIEPAEAAVADADPVVATAALNRGIERLVAHAPAQYQWTYKRFNLSFQPERNMADDVYGP